MWSWVQAWNLASRDWLAFFLAVRSAHFQTGTAPQPPGEPAGLPPRADWHYDAQYLEGVPSPAVATQPLSLQFLDAHRARSQGAVAGARSALLMGVVWLRSLPLLSGVARRIPQHWQTRVKSWLRA